MKTRLKKLLSVFLSIIMLLSITTGLDLSAYAITSGDFEYYVLDDGTAEITEYIGSATSVTIPSKIGSYTVTSIGYEAFSECTSLTNVTIPNSVKSIGDYAFAWCESLTSATIPNSVKSIGDSAFRNCTSLKSVIIPNSVTRIGNYTFNNCISLTSIIIPNSVTRIDNGAFSNCTSLTGVTIPDSVTSIGEFAFSDCTSLTSITIPNSVTGISNNAFSSCTRLTSVTIGNSVRRIGSSAFQNCTRLTYVTIHNSVTNIETWAFNDCSSLSNVYYTGSEEEWNAISIGYSNDGLTDAKIHYNALPPCDVHTPRTAVKENVKKATCTAAGSYDSVVYCSVCKHELNRTKKPIAKLGHNYKTTTTNATQTADGKIVKKCSECKHVASTTVIPKASSITISTTKYTYDGNYKKPVVTVKDRKGNKLSTANYSVAYSNNKYVGKASVKVTLKGDYSGTKTLYFTINPKGTTLSTLTATSKGFKVVWKKQSTQTTGYQIQYATNSKFDNAKTYTITSNSTTSKTISKLTAKKKYYVRVRTYKTVNGTKYYSAWSGYKYVTTKA